MGIRILKPLYTSGRTESANAGYAVKIWKNYAAKPGGPMQNDEQNAAPQVESATRTGREGPEVANAPSHDGHAAGPAVAAPDVAKALQAIASAEEVVFNAAIVADDRMRYEEGKNHRKLCDALKQAAALLVKLGQGTNTGRRSQFLRGLRNVRRIQATPTGAPMTDSPDEPQTPRTDEQIVTGQVCEDFKDARGKWLTQVKFERNTEWVCADLSRQLELELRGSLRIIDEMGVELRKAQALLAAAQEDLIWCGGSADFGPGGQAKVGYDKGPRATIAAIGEAIKP